MGVLNFDFKLLSFYRCFLQLYWRAGPFLFHFVKKTQTCLEPSDFLFRRVVVLTENVIIKTRATSSKLSRESRPFRASQRRRLSYVFDPFCLSPDQELKIQKIVHSCVGPVAKKVALGIEPKSPEDTDRPIRIRCDNQLHYATDLTTSTFIC